MFVIKNKRGSYLVHNDGLSILWNATTVIREDNVFTLEEFSRFLIRIYDTYRDADLITTLTKPSKIVLVSRAMTYKEIPCSS